MTTETIDLRTEFERVDEERENLAAEVAEAVADADAEVDSADAERGQELDRHYRGLGWALNEDAAGDERERDPYETVAISELTAGAYVKAGAEASADARDLDLPTDGDVERLYRVSNAVDDADFLDETTDPLVAVADLKPHFFFWLEDRVDDLTTPEIEGNSFGELVAANVSAMDQPSNGDSSSSSPE